MSRALDTLLDIGARPIHPIWVVTSLAALLALAAVSLTQPLGQLVAARATARPTPTPAAVFRLRLETADGLRRVRVSGPPGRQVLVLEGDTPLAVATLDPAGEAEIEVRSPISSAVPLRAVPLSLERVEAAPPAAAGTGAGAAAALQRSPIPTSPPSAAASPTPPPTATAAVAATTTPTATSPPPPPTATPTPTPIVVVPLPVIRAATPTPRPPEPTATVPPPTPRAAPATVGGPPVLHLVPDAGPRIAITFDGGAHSAHAAELLDLLTRLDLRVTLFLTGEFIAREPALVRRAVLAGHEVGNHTWSHSHLTTYAENRRQDLADGITQEWLTAELRRTEEAFRAATGRSMAPFWRAPFGEENRQLRAWALAAGYLHVRWSTLEGASLDSHDWIADEHSPLFTDSRTMMARLLRFPQLEGGIVLMHLSTERDEPPWTELPRFVTELRARGIEPVQVSDLLSHSRVWRPWLERARSIHQARTTAGE